MFKTNNVSAWSQDGLTATERFRQVVREMGQRQTILAKVEKNTRPLKLASL